METVLIAAAIVPAIYDEYVEPEPELLEGDEEEDFFED